MSTYSRLQTDADDAAFRPLRASESTGRPVGNADFIADLERRLARPIAKRAAGRKPKVAAAEQPDLLNAPK